MSRMTQDERNALTTARRKCKHKDAKRVQSYLRGLTRKTDSRAFRRALTKLEREHQ